MVEDVSFPIRLPFLTANRGSQLTSPTALNRLSPSWNTTTRPPTSSSAASAIEAPPGTTIRDALKHNGISPESVIATRLGEMLTDDERLAPGDEIKLVAVISGGADPETPPR